MELASTPSSLDCARCGDPIDETGYLPADEATGGYRPRADAAVCGDCGFNDVGYAGCAPEREDVDEAADTLLFVRRTDEGIDVLSGKS